jgi:hypothetical protein
MTNAVDIFSEFAINPDLENDGVWVPFKGDVEFCIARAGNKAYNKALALAFKRNKALLEGNTDASEEKSEEIMIEVTAKHILKGWKGKVALQGKVVEYSVDNAKGLLALKGFREWVMAQASEVSQYKAVQDEDSEKN